MAAVPELRWEPSPELKELYKKDSVTPLEVKEAIIECMTYAVGGNPKMAEMTVKHQFEVIGVSWINPSREDLVAVVHKLREMAGTFRDKDTIDYNFRKIMGLLRKCEC